MSPRIIQLPMSGGDRKHYVRELKAAESEQRALLPQIEAAYAAAYELECREWNTRQFIGGDAAPSPTIAQAIAAGRELLEVKCKRCGHEKMVDLRDIVWRRNEQVHTLAKILRCQTCSDERTKPQTDLVALHRRPDPRRPASAKRR